MRVRVLTVRLALGTALALAAGCGGGGGGGVPRDVRVSWTANRETAVNSLGGGYRVYYSTTQGLSVAAAPFVNVSYDAGAAASPTTATIPGLSPGTYYIKVAAYSALTPPGGSGGRASAPSAEISVTVP